MQAHKKRRPLHIVREKAAAALDNKAAEKWPGSPKTAYLAASAARRIRPDRHTKAKSVRRAVRVNAFFINRKLLKSVSAVNALLAAGTAVVIADLLILKRLPALKALEIQAGISAMAGANLAIEKRSLKGTEDLAKISAALINKPKLGREIVGKMKSSNLRDIIHHFSETKYIPKKERQGIAEKMWGGNKKAVTEATNNLAVAKMLYNSYKTDRQLTNIVTKFFFKQSGNTPLPRAIASLRIDNILKTMEKTKKGKLTFTVRISGPLKQEKAILFLEKTRGKWKYSIRKPGSN